MRPTYMPDILPNREKEINNLANVLVPALRNETPSNVFIYGKTGTGKTAASTACEPAPLSSPSREKQRYSRRRLQ